MCILDFAVYIKGVTSRKIYYPILLLYHPYVGTHYCSSLLHVHVHNRGTCLIMTLLLDRSTCTCVHEHVPRQNAHCTAHPIQICMYTKTYTSVVRTCTCTSTHVNSIYTIKYMYKHDIVHVQKHYTCMHVRM